MLDSIKNMKLVIVTPFYEMKGWSPYIRSLVESIIFICRHTNIYVDFWNLSGDSYVDRARNALAHQFKNSSFTDMLFIDSDMGWTIEGLTKLLAADVDVVGAGYPCKNMWDFYGCLLHVDKDQRPITNKHGLIKASSLPTGFMKIRQGVFQRLDAFFPNDCYIGDGPKDDKIVIGNYFGRIQPLGEDVSFCRRWTEAGGELWVEPNITISHYGVKDYTGNYYEFLCSCPGGSHDPNRGAV